MPLLDRQRATAAVLGAPPAAYFATSAVFHYLGPAFAVLLFARLEPLGVAGLRIATAAVDPRRLAPAVAAVPRLVAGDATPRARPGASCSRR